FGETASTIFQFAPGAIPIWVFIELGFLRGTRGTNACGPDPLDVRPQRACIGRGPPSEKQIGKPRPTPATLTIHFPGTRHPRARPEKVASIFAPRRPLSHFP